MNFKSFEWLNCDKSIKEQKCIKLCSILNCSPQPPESLAGLSGSTSPPQYAKAMGLEDARHGCLWSQKRVQDGQPLCGPTESVGTRPPSAFAELCSAHTKVRLISALHSFCGGLRWPFLSHMCAAALVCCTQSIFSSSCPPGPCSPSESISGVGGSPRRTPPTGPS